MNQYYPSFRLEGQRFDVFSLGLQVCRVTGVTERSGGIASERVSNCSKLK